MNPIHDASNTLRDSLQRMEEKHRRDLQNKVLEVARINALLARDPLTSQRRTKLLRLLGRAEREMKQAESWLNDVLVRLRATVEETLNAG